MLRLVGAHRPNTVVEPRRVAIWGLDAELAAYVESQLRAHWPRLTVQHASDVDDPGLRPADLWICGVEPPPVPQAPTLWLGDLDRGAGLVRVGDRLWTCPTPITGRQLLRSLDEMWRQIA